MTVQEILADVDDRIANEISAETKIRWINQIQRELFRDYPLPEDVYLFETIPNLQFYELPADCAVDRITNVVVGTTQYPYVSFSETAPFCFWTFIAGYLFLYPVPNEVLSVSIYYKPRPNELTSGNLQEKPNFPEDYHELLVYGCAIRVSQYLNEPNREVSFTTSFQMLAEKARREFKKPRPRKVMVERWR